MVNMCSISPEKVAELMGSADEHDDHGDDEHDDHGDVVDSDHSIDVDLDLDGAEAEIFALAFMCMALDTSKCSKERKCEWDSTEDQCAVSPEAAMDLMGIDKDSPMGAIVVLGMECTAKEQSKCSGDCMWEESECTINGAKALELMMAGGGDTCATLYTEIMDVSMKCGTSSSCRSSDCIKQEDSDSVECHPNPIKMMEIMFNDKGLASDLKSKVFEPCMESMDRATCESHAMKSDQETTQISTVMSGTAVEDGVSDAELEARGWTQRFIPYLVYIRTANFVFGVNSGRDRFVPPPLQNIIAAFTEANGLTAEQASITGVTTIVQERGDSHPNFPCLYALRSRISLIRNPQMSFWSTVYGWEWGCRSKGSMFWGLLLFGDAYNTARHQYNCNKHFIYRAPGSRFNLSPPPPCSLAGVSRV